jgi:ATP-dependent helicase/nuclease subunit A
MSLRPAPQARTAQVRASDPAASVFVAANAGSGKTSTLVKRVARLLLRGARPEAILCVTYTKAAAAEMQRRLFQELGGWAVMPDDDLAAELIKIEEPSRNFGLARALFARALETPGGIKIQTIHAFCEKLLRRFPLEAGVSPGFTVLEDVAARAVSAQAREDVARAALDHPESSVGRAYSHFSVELDYLRFGDMFAAFEAERRAIAAYVGACEGKAGFGTDIWRRCGFARPTAVAAVEAEAVGRIRWGQWRRHAQVLRQSGPTDVAMADKMLACSDVSGFDQVWAPFSTEKGELRKSLGAKAIDPATRQWLAEEGARLAEDCERRKAAVVAEASVHALSLAIAYIAFYEGAKGGLRALDFGDLIERTHELLTRRADAAWVLFKLDGGLDHVLLDEAQDTAPEQWDILRALTGEFFIGQGAGVSHRTVFAVGDEKQSIFSFQGAAPERFAHETEAFAGLVKGSGRPFERVPLLESWRSAPEILGFVDRVFEPPEIAAGLKPAGVTAYPILHKATREPGGTVDLWPLEETEPWDEPDPWAPVNTPPPESAGKKLAARIAAAIKAMVARGEAIQDRRTGKPRPATWGDVLILVRRRNALFHEIIRALKGLAVPVGGADRLLLSEHAAFQDLLALGRFARFPGDDLTLAALLRSPFCGVDEDPLFDLAHGRTGPLWATLQARADERPAWREAVRFLEWARREAEGRSPFDFYARVLSRLDEAGASMKRRMLTRLGREAEDAIDAFLSQALAAEQRGVMELERFVDEMAASEIEVKREQDDPEGRSAGEVRVMTAHGAKGLEAPIVILPDTTTRATAQGGPLLSAEGGGFLWAPRKADDCPASAEARAARETAAGHESLRLLYVALTRARDRLIVCGVKTQDQFFKGSWRDVVERGFAHEAVAPDVRVVSLEEGGTALRYGPDPLVLAAQGPMQEVETVLPDWVRRLAPAEAAATRYASPSRLGETAQASAPSPLAAVGGLGRYRRGDIVHRLLQLLPDMPADQRAAAAARLLARERDLTDDQRGEMAAAALAVLEDPRFAAVFGPGSRAEVAIAGAAERLPKGLAISGRVDRLLVTPDRVLVADFKTNRPSPERIEDADPAYVMQMAVYWAVLRQVFPGRAVEAALVWTDGPRLMPVPEILMAAALDGMAALS